MRMRIPARIAAVTAAGALLAGCAIGGSTAPAPAAAPSSGSESRAGAPLTAGFDESIVKACSADSPTLKAIKDRGVLQWGIGVSPPFGFKAADGSWIGVEADNARELAAILGVDVQIQDYDYGVMTTALQTGKADILGAQLFITPEREQAIGFSEFYYLSGQLFYVLKDSTYKTIDDLNEPGVRFVYGTGNAREGHRREVHPQGHHHRRAAAWTVAALRIPGNRSGRRVHGGSRANAPAAGQVQQPATGGDRAQGTGGDAEGRGRRHHRPVQGGVRVAEG